jgi:hypothetical protein
VRARGEGARRRSRGRCAGEERERGKGVLTRGADLAERERERGESGARAGRLAPTSGPGVAARERGGSVWGGRAEKRNGPAVAHAGEGKERGPDGEERGGLGCWAAVPFSSSSSSFLFLSYTQTIQTNLFEFK